MATVLTDVNIYTVSKDGKQKSLLGIAKQFTTPDAEVVTVEKKGVGDLSGEKLPIGVKLGTATLNINGFDKNLYKIIANPFKEFILIIKGSLKEYSGQTLTEETPARVVLRVSGAKFSQMGTFASQENVEQAIELNPTYSRIEVDGKVLSEIDISNRIWKVDDEDLLLTANKNMGIF
jgi:P2 family phage contractile tail tube protein